MSTTNDAGSGGRVVEFGGWVRLRYAWKTGDDRWDRVLLEQPDGYKIDLVSRFAEAALNYGARVAVRYWIVPRPVTKDEATAGFLQTLYGGLLEAEYETSSYRYSEWTSGTDYDTVLNVGKHSLYGEVAGADGKYVLLEVTFLDAPAPTNQHPSEPRSER